MGSAGWTPAAAVAESTRTDLLREWERTTVKSSLRVPESPSKPKPSTGVSFTLASAAAGVASSAAAHAAIPTLKARRPTARQNTAPIVATQRTYEKPTLCRVNSYPDCGGRDGR